MLQRRLTFNGADHPARKNKLAPKADSREDGDPRVTVVIPTYNRAGLVVRAIDSVLAQTMLDFEVIVVDDGSTDDTADVLAGVKDPRVRAIRLPGHSGVSRARNVAIAQARGEWVAFLDDDDEWLPGKLAAQLARVDASADARTSGVYCSVTFVGPDGPEPLPEAFRFPEGQIMCDLLLHEQMVSTSTYMVTRGALLQVGGFDELFEAVVDRDLWLRLAQAGRQFVAVPEPLVVLHREHSLRITADPIALVHGQARYQRRWNGLAKQCLGAEVRDALAANRRRMLERLHRKQVKRLLRRGNRRRAWRYMVAVVSALPTFPWLWPFFGRSLAVVALGTGAQRLVGLPRRPEPSALAVATGKERGSR